VHHLRCYVESYLLEPDNACPLCAEARPSARLWDNPLDLGEAAADSAESGAPLWAIGNLLRRGLDLSLDRSLRTLLRQGLAVPALRLKGCTPDALLKELDTRLMDVLLDETQYSAVELRDLGFDWKTYLLAGFRAAHVPKARARWGADLFRVVFVTSMHLVEFCSGDVDAMVALGLAPAEWRLLTPRLMAPAAILHQAGFKARHLIALNYSLRDWHEVMGLDRALMKKCEFDVATYSEFIQLDNKLRDEFVHRFKFDPFVGESCETSTTSRTPRPPHLSPWLIRTTPSASSSTVTNL
jgi:hypothetical protein